MNTNVVVGIPIIIPIRITEYDENGNFVSEILDPECFEGNIICNWSDQDGSEGMLINESFDDNETENGFYYNDSELYNCIMRYFNRENN